MKTLGERIRELRKSKKLTQEQLGAAIGTTKSSVSQWESGLTKKMDGENLARLAKFFGVSAFWLSTGEGGSNENVKLSEFTNVTEFNPKQLRKVPLISNIQAGVWREAIDNYHVNDAEDWVTCPVPHGDRTFVLRVNGNSMTSPHAGDDSFRNGDLIFIDPDREYVSGDYVVAKIIDSNEATFKQYVEDGGKKWLMPLNPKFDKIELVEGMHICGRMIYQGKSY